MARASIARRLLRQLDFSDIKIINEYYAQPPRRSKEEMVGQIICQTGTSLNVLVSPGLFPLTKWNEIVINQLDGSARKSFEAVAEEIEANLDLVYDEFDGNTLLSDIRDNPRDLRVLARKLGTESDELSEYIKEIHGLTQLSTFVKQYRTKQSNKKERSSVDTKSIRVASTRVKGVQSIEALTSTWMKEQIEDADSIDIAAGFYDDKFILDLIEKNSPVKNVRLIFNKLGGQRFIEQKKSLQTLQRNLENDGRDVEIRLARAPGMFHTKLFLSTKDGVPTALVGSANATNAALYQNEEILVALPDGEVLARYFQKAWAGALSINEADLAADSLVAFFRTGILYFKPVAKCTTSFNPFQKILSIMSPEDKKLVGAKKLRFSDQQTGIGPFNLKLAISTDIDMSNEDSEDNEKEVANASIVPYSIETCYGYWVPNSLNAELREKLQEAGRLKRAKWIELKKELNRSSEEILKKYQEYLDDARVVLEAVPNFSKKYLEQSLLNPFDLLPFKNFIKRVELYLESEERITRLSAPFIPGAMPEIWDDTTASDDFCDSFFDYLQQIEQKTKSSAKVAKIILAKIADEECDTTAEEFDTYLRTNPWPESYWNESKIKI